MPLWGQLLIQFAVRFGLEFLVKRFPGVPKPIIDLINDLMGQLKVSETREDKVFARKVASHKIKRYCKDGVCDIIA